MLEPLIKQEFTGTNREKYLTQIFDSFEDCNCKGFQFRHDCKHIRKLKKYYNLFNQNHDSTTTKKQ